MRITLLTRFYAAGLFLYGVWPWDSLEVEIRYEDCPKSNWAVCMCVNGLCHSIGDVSSRSVSIAAGTIVYSFTTLYNLSDYSKVTWNGHICHGRVFTTVVSHECLKHQGYLETISYDVSACKAVLVSYRAEACGLLTNLSIADEIAMEPPDAFPRLINMLDEEEASPATIKLHRPPSSRYQLDLCIRRHPAQLLCSEYNLAPTRSLPPLPDTRALPG